MIASAVTSVKNVLIHQKLLWVNLSVFFVARKMMFPIYALVEPYTPQNPRSIMKTIKLFQKNFGCKHQDSKTVEY